jgi:tetratricopeptide (TPR) repeat protein
MTTVSFFVSAAPKWAHASDSVQLQTLKTHSRLVLKIDESITSDSKLTSTGFEVLLKGVGLTDLGAPLGEEAAWLAQFKDIKDPRLSHIAFSEDASGLKIVGKWKFGKGPDAPANSSMEWFEYREKDPPAYVLDFWQKAGPSVGEVRAVQTKAVKEAQLKKAQEDARGRADRRLASSKKKAEFEDITKFCREPMAERKDIFLPFLPVRDPIKFSQWLPSTTADSRFSYYQPKTSEKDVKYVRLAQDLLKQGKPALVVRTVDFFESESSKSDFRHEMRFLKANALIRLGYHDQAEVTLRALMGESTESPVSLHSAMYLARKQFENGNYLGSLETFLWLTNRHSEYELNWVFHLGAAESLYALRQSERAAREYQWVVEHTTERRYQAEAALRMGDIFLAHSQYEQALATYSQAMRRYASETSRFPGVYLNRAEALYGLKEYDRSKEAFSEFLDKYSHHPYGWRATYRLGEIEGRKSVQGETRKWFSETINRFPFSPGATLARLRLLPCGDHGGFDFKAAERFFEGEAANFKETDEVSLALYGDLKGVTQVRTLISFDEAEKALDIAIAELQENRHETVRPILKGMLGGLFRRSIMQLLDKGKVYEALTYYTQKAKWVPNKNPDVDPDFMLKLSLAASEMGMGKLAVELATDYADVTTAPVSAFEGGRAPAGHVSADPNDIENRMRKSEFRFAQARGFWASGREKFAHAIRQALGEVIEESPHSFERELMVALLDEDAGQHTSSLAHALKAHVLIPANDPFKRDPSFVYWLARLESRSGDTVLALEMLGELEKKARLAGKEVERSAAAKFYGLPSVPSIEGLVIAQAELLEKQARWGEAAGTYARLFDEKKGGSQVAYGYARALLKAGGKQRAAKGVEVLKQLADPGRAPASGDDFWKKLAQEALETRRGNNE